MIITIKSNYVAIIYGTKIIVTMKQLLLRNSRHYIVVVRIGYLLPGESRTAELCFPSGMIGVILL